MLKRTRQGFDRLRQPCNQLADKTSSRRLGGGARSVYFADGDCKDYSIAKFFAQREAGLPAERLRLVIVRNRRRSEDHMVVAANVEDAWFILDNATMILATDTEDAARYTLLLLLDEAGVRRHQ